MTETSERRWGILRALKTQAPVENYLPEGHRVIAIKVGPGPHTCDEYIIEGPDMPPVRPGDEPEQVILVFHTDDSGFEYGSWRHLLCRRWPIAASSALIGD